MTAMSTEWPHAQGTNILSYRVDVIDRFVTTNLNATQDNTVDLKV